MRVLKDNVYKSILQVARKEFADKGFKEASMRSIAKGADPDSDMVVGAN